MVKTAFLFPGQGSFVPGILRDLADEGPVSETLRRADAVASGYGHGNIRSVLTDSRSPQQRAMTDAPSTLWLAIFTTSTALHAFLRAEGLRPDVLIGHSQGEIAALTAGGWLALEDGLRLLCEREAHLRAHSPRGGLLAVELGVRRTEGLIGMMGDATAAMAADNAPGQTVISGSEDSLATAQKVLAAMEVTSTRLRAPYPFHGPLLAGVTESFREVVDGVEFHLGHTPVFSPILGRPIASVDDARAVVRNHLVQPVWFRKAVFEVLADGVDRFVECGAKSILVDLARRTTPNSVDFLAPLTRRAAKADVHALFDASADAPVAPHDESAAGSVPETPAVPAAAEPETTPVALKANGRLPEADVLIDELRQIFAEQLGYPLDVLTDDVDLEADLGISSVKQIELFTIVLDRYNLATPPSDIRPGLFATLPDLATFLRRLDDDAAKAA
ncbi:Malonyl CoA-acyl carrier protein transacylase [Lentzea xinjiangensis]|uniref:Malonyl CoA-acyl carrier protein transacylase n=2 Tax=Lentzea xinjiangensis TaxID=402600 RepID=A0A1H9WS94_9PSEU|nr:acyltransferase domain-containing protein [Lentzea xinjiangensis]SES36694.1 Malonyl CoA-acyl carrier protein transacylase [Lentzea xinjiangensis]